MGFSLRGIRHALGKPTWRGVDGPHSHLLLTWRGRWVPTKLPTPNFSSGLPLPMPPSTPLPSLPLLSYCQTSSPGKVESSDDNVLVDLAKIVGQTTSGIYLIDQAHDTDQARGHIDRAQGSTQVVPDRA